MAAEDRNAPKHGLPRSMRIPIAARTIEDIEAYVGQVIVRRGAVGGLIGALLVDTSTAPIRDQAKFWSHPLADLYAQRLFPSRQVWVHVDFRRYRDAYLKFAMPPLAIGDVLDHIQNRRAIRLRNYSHPYLRLCPVSPRVNSSSGVVSGAEGMERAHLASASSGNAAAIAALEHVKRHAIVYADPVDITKMLNIAPGTVALDGVRDVQALYFE